MQSKINLVTALVSSKPYCRRKVISCHLEGADPSCPNHHTHKPHGFLLTQNFFRGIPPIPNSQFCGSSRIDPFQTLGADTWPRFDHLEYPSFCHTDCFQVGYVPSQALEYSWLLLKLLGEIPAFAGIASHVFPSATWDLCHQVEKEYIKMKLTQKKSRPKRKETGSRDTEPLVWAMFRDLLIIWVNKFPFVT